ncbi:ATP synthase gamma chain [Striga asiatica]|uniref:ATP synthase gamma chain n=1 Tax=Striga asiatica TaxID=4170 RepID=A0A5A7RK80_STRAF|nr:ATP synthase gamma chain [Striga asiatica]
MTCFGLDHCGILGKKRQSCSVDHQDSKEYLGPLCCRFLLYPCPTLACKSSSRNPCSFHVKNPQQLPVTMNPTKALSRAPTTPFFLKAKKLGPNVRWAVQFRPKFVNFRPTASGGDHLPVTTVASDVNSVGLSHEPKEAKVEKVEVYIEKLIYGCRFFAILAVWGSLVGSFLCFVKGCVYVVSSFQGYFVDRGKTIASLVEATDVYLLGTVMLVFGMGLYELFISNLDKSKSMSDGRITYRSSLFGLFTLKERPRWLEIKTVNELKTKLGHVIVMLLLIGLFDKSKKTIIQSPFDLLCFSASVLLSSGCLFLLSKLNE